MQAQLSKSNTHNTPLCIHSVPYTVVLQEAVIGESAGRVGHEVARIELAAAHRSACTVARLPINSRGSML